jgi:hypothetical protein
MKVNRPEYKTRRQWIKTVAAAGTPERLTSFAYVGAAIEDNGTTIYVSTPSAHQLKPEDQIVISGSVGFNHRYVVTDIISATIFRALKLSSFVSADENPVNITIVAHIFFKNATILGKKAARTANATTAYIGPESTNDSQPFAIVADGEISLHAPDGEIWNLADWYCDVTTAADGAVILVS